MYDKDISAISNKHVTISSYDWGGPISPYHDLNTAIDTQLAQLTQCPSDPEERLSDNAFDLILISDCILPKLYPIEPLVKVNQ